MSAASNAIEDGFELKEQDEGAEGKDDDEKRRRG